MLERPRTASSMAFRDQRRRPVVLILLVIVPAYVVTRSIAITQPTPRQIGLPGGATVTTTMRDLHGAVMAGTAIAFVAALVGVFVMQSALQADRRLIVAGFRPAEAIAARLLVLLAATMLVVAVSAVATAAYFTPASWPSLVAAWILLGMTYAAIGALAGAALGKLAATYLVLFLALTDLGIVQNPMFGTGTPGRFASLLPGYGASRMMVDGAFSSGFHTAADLLFGLAWLAALLVILHLTLRRALGTRAPAS
jgi:hypothetical protein